MTDNFKKALRYAKVSTTVGRMVVRVAGHKYLGMSWDHDHYSALLKETLGRLKGPVMKIGQILATVPDVLPAEYAEKFLTLQAKAPPMGWHFVKRRMSAELGEQWESQFHYFEKTAVAAASLGQVHRAVSLEGLPLACKLQYPQMKAAIESDLKQLNHFLRVYEYWAGVLSTKHLQKEVEDSLMEELDYEQEARNMMLFSQILAPYEGIHVPQVVSQFSTKRLLTMTWQDGEPFLNGQSLPQSVREEIIRNLFKAWYRPLYGYGVLHGDPHLGNYTIQKHTGHINILDFGCVRILSPRFLKGSLLLYRALQGDNKELACEAYELLGFGNITTDLLETLNLWARFLYNPLLRDEVCSVSEGFSGNMGKDIALSVYQQLKAKGGVTPPREFLFMQRAAVGIGSASIHLRVALNWHELFEEIISEFSEVSLAETQDRLFQIEDKVHEAHLT